MNKKRLDSLELTKRFNELRMKELGNIYPVQAMSELIRSIGINGHIFNKLSQAGVFEKSKVGKRTMYKFSATPLYKDIMKDCCENYSAYTKKESKGLTEEIAINFLKSKGYKVQKEDSFDLETLKKENPELYSRYIVYKEV